LLGSKIQSAALGAGSLAYLARPIYTSWTTW